MKLWFLTLTWGALLLWRVLALQLHPVPALGGFELKIFLGAPAGVEVLLDSERLGINVAEATFIFLSLTFGGFLGIVLAHDFHRKLVACS